MTGRRPRDRSTGRFLPALALPAGFEQTTEPAVFGPTLGEFLTHVDANPAPAAPDTVGPGPAGFADQLFGATSATSLEQGRMRPYAVIELNGVDLAGSVNRANPAGQVVLDDVSVSWGTSEPLAQADPASATLSLLDFSLTWGARGDLMGKPLNVRWVLDADPAGAWAYQSRTYFRGRITDVDLTPEAVTLPDGSRRQCTRVDLRCASTETDLGNVFPAETVWPEESINDRTARLRALVSATAIPGLGAAVEPRLIDWGGYTAYAVDQVNTRSARDLLLQLFNSCGGDRMVYNPHRNAYEWLGRRQADVRSFAVLQRQVDTPVIGRAGRGIYARTAGTRAATGATLNDTLGGLYIDGAVLESAGSVSKSQASRITRASVTSRDTGIDGDPQRVTTLIDPSANETVIGQRSITLDSLHGWNSGADLNARDLLAMATQEGSQWTPPPARWDTRRTDGFILFNQATGLLRGYATGFNWFVGHSWMSGLGVRPVFSVIGGTIAFRDGFFVLDMNFAGWATSGGGLASPVPTKQHPISWEEISVSDPADRLVWGTGVPGPRTFHESVTYEDLRYVGQGYFTNTIGPDKGYDEYQ